MSGDPRPANPDFVRHEISVAVLATTGQWVINCWDYWLGGFEIVHRFPVDDPDAVRAAGEWAVANHADWRESGYPVQSVAEVVRTFVH